MAINVVMRASGLVPADSFRQIAMRCGGKLAGKFYAYDPSLRGDDRLVQPDDVIHVLPAGQLVALRGSVNKQTVYEVKAGDSPREMIGISSPFSPVADRTRVALERLDNRNARCIVQLQLPEQDSAALVDGNAVRAFSAVASGLSVQRQNKRVMVDGEVMRPGEYVLPAETSLSDALRAAGGLTPAAYPFAAVLQRESVKASQRENLDRILRVMVTELVCESTAHRGSTAEEAGGASARATASSRLLERLRSLQPTGRLVFQIPPETTELPDIRLEDGDRLAIPPKPSTVGVFGSVFNAATYLHTPGRNILDYLRRAGGGPPRGSTTAASLSSARMLMSSAEGSARAGSARQAILINCQRNLTTRCSFERR